MMLGSAAELTDEGNVVDRVSDAVRLTVPGDEVSVEAGVCYVPRAPNNPLFDAFFYEVPPEGADPAAEVVLWILQVTVNTSHMGRADGFAIVENLQTTAATKTRGT